MSQEATKRERRVAARDDRKRRASVAQRAARIRQIVVLAIVALALVGLVIAAVTTSFFGLATSTPLASVGRTVAIEGADHVAQDTPLTFRSRPPTSGTHYSTWLQTFGFMNPAPPTGNWVHNLEHGAIVILYNCPQGCADLEQQLQELYPNLPLGRNARRGMPRAIIIPYADMDRKIAVVAWGWLLELDEFDQDQIIKFYESRLDRGPECRDLVCPS